MTFEKECQGFGLLTSTDNLKVPVAALIPDNSTLLVEKFDGNQWLFSGEILPKPQIVASHPFADRTGHAHHTPSPEEMAMRREQHQEAVRIAHQNHLERERQREQAHEDDLRRAIALSLSGNGDDDDPYDLSFRSCHFGEIREVNL